MAETPAPTAPYPGNYKLDEDLKPQYTLTDEENGLVSELQNRIADAINSHSRKLYCKKACFVRYLRARDWKVDAAEKLLRKTLEWRDEYGVEHITPDSLDHEASTGKIYVNGHDRVGHPVMYQKPRNQNTKDYDNQTRLVAYTLERESGTMDLSKGVEQHVIIIDFKGYSMWNAPPMSQSREVLNILQSSYPERMAACFLVDPPTLFYMAYKVLQVLLSKATKDKLFFVSRKGKHGATGKMDEAFTKFFDAEQLEEDYGGTLSSEYQHEMYWAKEREYYDEVQRLKAEGKEANASGGTRRTEEL